MAVGVVARQVAVVYPQHAVGTEVGHQPLFYLVLGEGLVAVGSQQAAGGGEDGAPAVALDGAAFEHEVQMVYVLAADGPLIVEAAVDGIVLAGRKLLAPSVETKVEQQGRAAVAGEADEAVVAGPGVVGIDVDHLAVGMDCRSLGRHHEQGLALADFAGHRLVGLREVVKHGCPVGIGVWPRQLHAALRLPFSR